MTDREYKIVRVARDSEYNKRQREIGGAQVYDFHVTFNGVAVAMFHRNFGLGYELWSYPDFFPITAKPENHPSAHNVVRVNAQAEFVSTIDALLLAGRIPTPADMIARMEGAARAETMNREIAELNLLKRIVAQHAWTLYDAVRAYKRLTPLRARVLDVIQTDYAAALAHNVEMYGPTWGTNAQEPFSL